MIMTTKCYDKGDWNPHYFFQPASPKGPLEVTLIEQPNALPSPMEKHRVPRLRLVPPGSLDRR